MDDTALIGQCLEGDREAFGILVQKHQGAVYNLACRMIGDFEEAKDLTQTAFLKAYLHLSDLQDPTRFPHWLYRITVNECKMWFRSPLRGQLSLEEITSEDAAIYCENGELPYSPFRARGGQESVEAREMREMALRDVETLSPSYRLPVILFYVDGLSYREIAHFLRVPVSTVKWRLHKALEQLRERAMGSDTLKRQHLPQDFAQSVVEAAIRHTENSEWEQAMEKYRKVVAANPHDFTSCLFLGRVYYRKGLYDEAIELLENVAAVEYEDGIAALDCHLKHSGHLTVRYFHSWTQVTLGWCYDAKGEREKAVEQYQRALDLILSESAATAALRGLEAPHPPKKSVPSGPVKDREIPPVGWTARASHRPEDVAKAFDRNNATFWKSWTHQRPGMYFQVDLGNVYTIDRVLLDDDGRGSSIYVSDYPRQYVVEVSQEGATWKEVGAGHGSFDTYACTWFDPVESRYVKITQLGYCVPEWWTIYEVYVYTPE